MSLALRFLEDVLTAGQVVSCEWSSHLGPFIAKQNGDDLLVGRRLAEAGKVTPVIGSTYPSGGSPTRSGEWERGTVEARSSLRSEVR